MFVVRRIQKAAPALAAKERFASAIIDGLLQRLFVRPVPSLVNMKTLAHRRLWLRFSDGVEGEVDISEFAGRGVFSAWDERVSFNSARIGPVGQVAWEGGLEICADMLYMRLTGESPEQVFQNLREMGLYS